MLFRSVALLAVSFLLLDAANAVPTCTKTKHVQTHDTCKSIAANNHISYHQFLALNPTLKCKALPHGKKVCVAGKASPTKTKSKGKATPTPTNVCRQYTDNFKSAGRIKSEDNYHGNPKSADWVDLSGNSKTLHLTSGGGLEMRVLSPGKVKQTKGANDKIGQGATINSTYLLNYGAVEAKMRMSPVPGIVTAFITMSDNGDEIDWEWVGKKTTLAQSNYYYNGIPDYSKGQVHHVTAKGKNIDNSKEWAIFRLELQPDYIRWLINGDVVRTVFRNTTAKGKPPVYHFPYHKARVQLGLWDSSFDAGTAQWANGPVDWNHLGPYVSAFVEYVKIECDPRYNKVIH